jgi:hypothetical protein
MTSLKTVETDLLRILLIRHGLSSEQLAVACGVQKITIFNEMAKNFPSLRLRLVVETVLEQAIWSSQAEFDARRHLAQRLGFDAFTIPDWQLRQRVSALKLRGRSKARRKGELIALLQSHFPEPSQTHLKTA